jgi:hypothetical protein
MLCDSSYLELEPKLELNSHREIRRYDQQSVGQLAMVNGPAVFGTVAMTRVLCKCGAVAELDRSVLKTKRYLGKNVECRRCRNIRIAREKEELDKEYFDIHETLD